MGTTAVIVKTRTGNNITKTGYGYEVTKQARGENYQVQVSDFEFDLLSVIVMGDALLFEVEVNGGRVLDGTVYQVPSDLFSSMPRFKKWCQGRELEWSGDQAALDGVYSLLNHQDVPRRRGVSVVGLHKTANGFTWVLPDESFGADPDDIVFVPPPAGDLWSKGINLVEDGNYNLRAIELLAQLHDPKIMTPILGWMAAAPLRSQCPKFPPLIVTGGSGYGKTTILETVMRTFGYWTEPAISLGSATPYTVDAYCASSNAFPVWFDEYRGSKFGRLETRLAIQQAVRDAFDGASTPKGGGGENHLGIINQPKIAPLIVSGEDELTEVSHVERSLMVKMPKDGRNREALFSLIERRDDGFPMVWEQGFGSAYLEWLITLPYEFRMPPVNTDRKTLGEQMARWGYDLLTTFIEYIDPDISMPKFDYSQVNRDQNEALSANPVVEAIAEAEGVTDKDNRLIVFDWDGYRCVRVGALVDWINKYRADSITLPGGRNAIIKLLIEEFDAQQVQMEIYDESSGETHRPRVVRWPFVPDEM